MLIIQKDFSYTFTSQISSKQRVSIKFEIEKELGNELQSLGNYRLAILGKNYTGIYTGMVAGRLYIQAYTGCTDRHRPIYAVYTDMV